MATFIMKAKANILHKNKVMQGNNKKIFSINQRILQIIDFLGVTRYKVSQETGISETVLLNIYKGKNKPSFDVIEKILNNYPEINAEWFLTGKGVMLKNQNHLIGDTETEDKGIPFIHLNNVSDMFSNENKVAEKDSKKIIVPSLKGADFLVGVEGNSMNPKYSSGDIVICRKLPIDTFIQWNMVYIIDTDQGALLKRIKKGNSEETVLVVSENPDYETFELNRSQIYNIAIVLGVIRIE